MLRITSDDSSFSRRTLCRLVASGLPRAMQTMLESDFAIFTASRGEYSSEENKKRMKRLKRQLRNLGYGFVNTAGVWNEKDIYSGVRKWLSEDSIFVPGISEEWTRILSQQFGQESYIWGTGGVYWLKDTEDGSIGLTGPVKEHFRLVTETNPSDYYTQFKKEKHRPFVFDENRKKKKEEELEEKMPESIKFPTVISNSNKKHIITSRLPVTASRKEASRIFYSFAGIPKYVGTRYGIKEMSDVPDVSFCDAWLPLWEI